MMLQIDWNRVQMKNFDFEDEEWRLELNSKAYVFRVKFRLFIWNCKSERLFKEMIQVFFWKNYLRLKMNDRMMLKIVNGVFLNWNLMNEKLRENFNRKLCLKNTDKNNEKTKWIKKRIYRKNKK